MTQTIEYRTMDKSAWERGPWDAEVDKKQWQDPETGFACLIKRNHHGALCGYVGMPSSHPWHGKGYDDIEDYPSVHGGLTFASGCRHDPDPSQGICHVPSPGEPDDVWWLGFDCAHSGDDTSFAKTEEWRVLFPRWAGDVYRDQAYVESECASLAKQAAQAR